jgi:hypothetical protein
MGESEYNRLRVLAMALVELIPKLEAKTSVLVDSQEDLGHQGLEYDPSALKSDAADVSQRTLQILTRYRSKQPVGWDEYEELLVDLKTLISRVDSENPALEF